MRAALEKIQAAEERNEEAKKTLVSELQAYEQQRKAALAAEERLNREEITKETVEKETDEQQALEAERRMLVMNADALQNNLEQSYQKNATKLIDEIIERVKESYGRH